MPTIAGVSITLDNVRKFAPKVILHQNEVYLPCDIEFILQGSSLQIAPFLPGTSVNNPSQADLATNSGGENVLSLDSVDRHGFPPVDGAVNAPFYVAIQGAADGSFFDLT